MILCDFGSLCGFSLLLNLHCLILSSILLSVFLFLYFSCINKVMYNTTIDLKVETIVITAGMQ